MAMIKHNERWAVFRCFFQSFEDDLQKEPGSDFYWGDYYTILIFSQQKPCCSSSIMLCMSPHAFVLSIRRHLLVCVNLTQTAWNGDSRLMTGDHTENSSKPMHLW